MAGSVHCRCGEVLVEVLCGDRPVVNSLVGTAFRGESLVETLERLLESQNSPEGES